MCRLPAVADTGGGGIPTSGRAPVLSGAQLRAEHIRCAPPVRFRTGDASQLA